MVKELIKIVKDGERFKIAETDEAVVPKKMGKSFNAETIEQLEDKASNFPWTPSPNAYQVVSRSTRIAKVQLFYLRDDDYAEGFKALKKQRRQQRVF